MKKLLLTATLGVATILGATAGNFNFPQEANYAYGTMVSNRQSSTINTLYTNWKKNFYEENTSKTMGRIKFDNTTYTVSEGIGYGMLIFVYMENATNSTQDEFNKLWAYYKNFGRFNGYLMDWKIEGFTKVATTSDCYQNDCHGSATDGDLDVAAALILAHKQWGSTGTVNYISEAENLLSNIYDKQVDGSKLFKPGDHWSGPYNPCYFTTASVKLFDVAQTEEGFTKTRDWATVYTKSQEFLVKASSPRGLYPDWCNANGDKYDDRYNFSWDACRTPWRIAWDYSWFGNASALAQSKLTADNFKTTGASSVAAVYDINTGVSSDGVNNTCFIGGIGASFMTNSAYQSKLDEYYNHFVTKSETYGYYAPTLQVLYAIYFSGNAVNPYSQPAVATAPALRTGVVDATTNGNILLTFSSDIAAFSGNPGFTVKVNGAAVTVSGAALQSNTKQVLVTLPSGTITAGKAVSVTYTGTSLKGANTIAVAGFSNTVTNSLVDASASVLIDDCNDGNNVTALGGQWFTYTDVTDKGLSTVTPVSASFTMTGAGYNGSAKSAQITFVLNGGTCSYCPFVGLGFNTTAAQTALDMTGTTGITFYHKGAGFTPEIALSTITNFQNFIGTAVPAHTDWTLVTVNWSSLSQPDWGDKNKYVSWDVSKITKIQFKVTNASGGTSLQLDDIKSVGLFSTAPANKVPTVKTPIANLTLATGYKSKDISLATLFADADGDALNMSATSSKTTVATVAVVGKTLTITEVGAGTTTITVSANDGNGGTITSTFTLTVTAGTPNSVKEIATGAAVLYPVPLSDKLFITSEKAIAQVEIFSANGQLFAKLPYSAEGYSLEGLGKGLCTVKITYTTGESESHAVTK